MAVLVRDGGSAVLIDTGPSDGAVVAALSRVDAVRTLDGAGRTLDAVVITHADDHAGGLANLQRRTEIGRLLGDGAVAPEPLDIGDRIRLSARTTIEVISLPLRTAGREHASENNHSLVLLVTIGQRRILVGSDIEAEAEGWLASSGTDLRADALVVPHHGSKTSSTREFLDAVRPLVAVVPVGANSYGHPDPDVLARYRASGVTLLRTDEHGDVTLRSDGHRLWVETSR